MIEPMESTIDSRLQSDRFEESHFSQEQRMLMRAFFRHPASAWVKPNAHLRGGDATGSKRWREYHPPLEQHARLSASSATNKRPKNTTTISRCTTVSPSPAPSSSASASPPPGTSHRPSVLSTSFPVAAATAVSKSHRSCRTETLALRSPSQELEISEPLISKEELVTSYSPIDDIDGFIQNLQCLQVRENQLAFPQDTSHADTVFCLYITAKSRERMSKAIAKIAATVLVSLYPTQQLTSAAVEVCKTHSGTSETNIRALFKSCKKLGRACHHVRKVLGSGAILLLDDFSAW